MNHHWGDKTVGSIVAGLPAAAGVFKANGIDYCCGGQRLLSGVMDERKVNKSQIEEQLDMEYEKAQRVSGMRDLRTLGREELSNYIETKHHSYLREALPQIGDIFMVVLKAHGKNHPELFDLFTVFNKLKGDLEQHLIKEETMLFPAINGPLAAVIRDLARQIKKEHEEAGKALEELRRISNDYALPHDACPTYHKLFSLLEGLEDDLHQHVHLENNILLADIH